jgi:anti-sigma regulatory factor (Ser/Thr protein kinase)
LSPEHKLLDDTIVSRIRCWDLTADDLRSDELVPTLVEAVCRDFVLDQQRPVLYMIFSELMSNAIDHGVLGLSSALKDDGDDGFEKYLKAREHRLQQLLLARVAIVVEHRQVDGWLPQLRITVTDFGAGFDYARVAREPVGLTTLHGRGLAILRNLCSSVRHRGNGNCIEVEFLLD